MNWNDLNMVSSQSDASIQAHSLEDKSNSKNNLFSPIQPGLFFVLQKPGGGGALCPTPL